MSNLDLLGAVNTCFWEHEWDCHGSCSGLTQQDYFQDTLKLHYKYDIAVSPQEAEVLQRLSVEMSKRFSSLCLHCTRTSSHSYLPHVFDECGGMGKELLSSGLRMLFLHHQRVLVKLPLV